MPCVMLLESLATMHVAFCFSSTIWLWRLAAERAARALTTCGTS